MIRNYISLPIILISFFATSLNVSAQDDEFAELDAELNASDDTTITNQPVTDVFNSTRIINGHSTETLRKKVMEFRIEHRFGDIAGSAGGVQQMFGFDNIADIRLALEYGITDKIMIGFGRAKGSGNPYRSLVDGFVKYRFIDQKKGGSPVSVSALGLMTFTYMKASTDSTQLTYFPKFIHRLSYASQINISRKFHERFSMAIIPTVVHQNYVDAGNQNTIFALGGGARIGITNTFGILLEYYHCMTNNTIRQNYTNSLSVAAEFITFGHNFTLFFSNARGLGETQFITNTTSDWLKGQFRFGFAVGRKFEY